MAFVRENRNQDMDDGVGVPPWLRKPPYEVWQVYTNLDRSMVCIDRFGDGVEYSNPRLHARMNRNAIEWFEIRFDFGHDFRVQYITIGWWLNSILEWLMCILLVVDIWQISHLKMVLEWLMMCSCNWWFSKENSDSFPECNPIQSYPQRLPLGLERYPWTV